MNRLTFLKRLLGGVVAAPVVAKALAKEQAPLPLPSFGGNYSAMTGNFMVSSYPVTTGFSEWYVSSPKEEIVIHSVKPKRRRKRK